MSYNVVDQSTGDLEQIAGSTLTAIYADSPLGVILPFGGSVAPKGFLICDGSAVSRTTYADLFAVIGTKFGSGDGSTTFNLPTHAFGANLYPNVEAKYIIKAVQTALPSDIQSQVDGCAKLAENNSFDAQNTMLGKHQVLKDTNIIVGGTPPVSTTGGNSALQIKDNEDHVLGYLNYFFENDGSVDMHLHANASGNQNGKLYLAGSQVLVNGVDIIDKVNKVTPDVTVNYDGVKTNVQVFNELYAAIDFAKLKPTSLVKLISPDYTENYIISRITSTGFQFSTLLLDSSVIKEYIAVIREANSAFQLWTITTSGISSTDMSSSVPSAGYSWNIYY